MKYWNYYIYSVFIMHLFVTILLNKILRLYTCEIFSSLFILFFIIHLNIDTFFGIKSHMVYNRVLIIRLGKGRKALVHGDHAPTATVRWVVLKNKKFSLKVSTNKLFLFNSLFTTIVLLNYFLL